MKSQNLETSSIRATLIVVTAIAKFNSTNAKDSNSNNRSTNNYSNTTKIIAIIRAIMITMIVATQMTTPVKLSSS